MDDAIVRHCRELNRCNQRGGRMLSIFDLLDAGTMSLDLAAYLMDRISQGASFMVGARPGGAGKTTVMCALLNLLPPGVELIAAAPEAVREAAHRRDLKKRCYVCHEIGNGPYFAYLWNRDLRAYCALRDMGHLLAANLHADDLDEAREQVCSENAVPDIHFNRFDLILFLRVHGRQWNARRVVEKVYASSGITPHRLVFNAGAFADKTSHDGARHVRCRTFLEGQLANGVRTIEETRERVVNWFSVRA